MAEHETEGLFDPQKGLPKPDRQEHGNVNLGNERGTPTVSEGDSPNRGSVDGPLPPELTVTERRPAAAARGTARRTTSTTRCLR